jgi:hypothetical protein
VVHLPPWWFSFFFFVARLIVATGVPRTEPMHTRHPERVASGDGSTVSSAATFVLACCRPAQLAPTMAVMARAATKSFIHIKGYVFMDALADFEASGLIAYNLIFAELTVITVVFLPTKVKSRS